MFVLYVKQDVCSFLAKRVFTTTTCVAHDHQKWLHMDLIHLFEMLIDYERFCKYDKCQPDD